MKIINNTEKAQHDYIHRHMTHGTFKICLTEKQIKALRENKLLATTINCDEYTIFISYKEKLCGD